MYIADHLARAERIEATNRRLDLADDYEMVLWNCVHIATQYFNAALHAAGVTEERGDYPSAEAFYYHARRGPDDQWKVIRAPYGDLVHSHVPGADAPALAPEPGGELGLILADLRQIESYRPKYVRGDEPFNPQDGISCLQACERVKQLAIKVISSTSGGRP